MNKGKDTTGYSKNHSLYPIETCPKCLQTYWACQKCGESPMGGIHAKKEDKPQQCTNQYCRSKDHLVFKTIKVCCRRHFHWTGNTCQHCGTRS